MNPKHIAPSHLISGTVVFFNNLTGKGTIECNGPAIFRLEQKVGFKQGLSDPEICSSSNSHAPRVGTKVICGFSGSTSNEARTVQFWGLQSEYNEVRTRIHHRPYCRIVEEAWLFGKYISERVLLSGTVEVMQSQGIYIPPKCVECEFRYRLEQKVSIWNTHYWLPWSDSRLSQLINCFTADELDEFVDPDRDKKEVTRLMKELA